MKREKCGRFFSIRHFNERKSLKVEFDCQLEPALGNGARKAYLNHFSLSFHGVFMKYIESSFNYNF